MNFQIQGEELFLSGKICLSEVSTFREILIQHIAQCKTQVILNLREVETLELNALQLLISAKKTARKENKTLLLSEVNRKLYETFTFSGLAPLFKIPLD